MKKKICIWALVFLLPFIIYIGSFRLIAFDNDFYSDEFIKNNVDVEGKSEISTDMIYFLKNKDAGIERISSFNLIEQEHLIEVRDVMHWFILVFNLAVFLFIANLYLLYFFDKKNFYLNLGKGLFYGSVVGVGIGVLLVLSVLSFDKVFAGFHALLFETQWQFPAGYLLASLFPRQFFIDIFTRIVFISFMSSLVLGGIGYYLGKKQKVYK